MHMAAVIEQRRSVGMVCAAFDLADEEQMIALLMLTQIAALEHRRAAFQQRHAMCGVLVTRMAEAVGAPARKQLGQRLCAADSTWTA